ncbi:MAG: LPS export ABC transporter periplasmic protein LptC [Steroidobacteraceae bacterium]|jgi:lipopolysaccharide export system protein LptC
MLFRTFTLLAVVALAVSTWILSSPAHRPAPTQSTGKAELPGYYLKNATLTDFDADGAPTIRLEAERIDQVDHGTEVTLSNVRVHYQAPNGQTWLLVGDTGRVEPGGKVIDVAGHVQLQGDSTEHAGTVIVHTEALSYDVPGSIAATPDDVRVDFGAHTLTARGLRANLKERTLHLDSRVNGRFQP